MLNRQSEPFLRSDAATLATNSNDALAPRKIIYDTDILYQIKCPQGDTYQKPVTASSPGGATLDIGDSIAQICSEGKHVSVRVLLPCLITNPAQGKRLPQGLWNLTNHVLCINMR
jgi:hypothetical protein